MTAGTCRYCGCTESDPCATGCAWSDANQTECSACTTTAAALVAMLELLRRLPASSMRIDLGVAFSEQPVEEQTKLIMACRAMLEGLLEQQGEEIFAFVELQKLNDYLAEHHPDHWNADVGHTGASPVDVAITLLGERRIVLAR